MTNICSTKGHLRVVERALEGCDYVALDTETTGLDQWAPDFALTMVQLTIVSLVPQYSERTYIVPLDHPESAFQGQWRQVAKWLAQKLRPHRLVAHNAVYDLIAILKTTGIDLSGSLEWDTMISSHLLRPSDRASISLKDTAVRDLGVAKWDDGMAAQFKKPGASKNVPMSNLAEYGALDTAYTSRLYRLHSSILSLDEDIEIEFKRLRNLHDAVALPTVLATMQLQVQGLPLDREWIEERMAEEREIQAKAMTEFSSTYDIELWEGTKKAPRRTEPSIHATSKYFVAWMDQAVMDGHAAVTELTPKGKPKWDRHVIAKQVRNNPDGILAPILTARKAGKRLEYLGSMNEWDRGGWVHPNYRPGTLTTGRLASSDPNPMQWEYALKPGIKAPEGYYVLDADFSQVELRVAADVAQIHSMAAAYLEGADIHRRTVANMLHKPESDVTKAERQLAKAQNFGLIFGQGVASFRDFSEKSYGVDLTLEEAQEAYDNWHGAYPEVIEWHKDVEYRLYKDRQITSITGRIRRFPNPWGENRNAAINFGVQSVAGDLFQIALAKLTQERAETGILPIAVVHDSIVALVPIEGWQRSAQHVRQVMTEYAPRTLEEKLVHRPLYAPFEAGLVVGTRWGKDDILGEDDELVIP